MARAASFRRVDSLGAGQRHNQILVEGPRQRGRGHRLQPKWDGSDSLRERFEAVRPLLGGSVLDVGCASRYGRPDWVHGLIAQDVGDVVGIDVNDEVVSKVRKQGFDVRVADARGFDIGRRFDTVFAGEIIEHLDDVRAFLGSVHDHLEPAGSLVLTTPNCFYVGNFVYRLGGQGRVHHEHTAWYCADTLRRVLHVNGFPNVRTFYIGHRSMTPLRRLATGVAQRTLPPALAYDTLVAVARTEANPQPRIDASGVEGDGTATCNRSSHFP